MSTRVIVAGLMGGMVIVIWIFIINGIFGFRASLEMKQIPAERQVYETLKEHITQPGRYALNPALNSERRFPAGEPVFSVLYGGIGSKGLFFPVSRRSTMAKPSPFFPPSPGYNLP